MQPIITVKQLVKIYKDFNELWKTLQTDKAKFDEITLLYCAIINKCEMDRIPYYVDEYYTKVAAIYDAVDTLEFGKLRTETQKAMHKNYLSVTMRGAFLATAYDGEKDIALSYCSHEGLKVHIKNKIVRLNTVISHILFTNLCFETRRLWSKTKIPLMQISIDLILFRLMPSFVTFP
jgi:hypothetical protein